MKYIFLSFLCLICNLVTAQIKPNKLWGSWVVKKVTYKDGSELPDENILKYTYVKYTFESPDKMYISPVYFEKGGQVFFEVNDNHLILRSSAGSIMNDIRIEELNSDRLILLQRGVDGFDDPTALKYYFIPENVLQNSIHLTANDIHSINGNDTVYKENPKIYAKYKEGGFLNYMYSHIGDGNFMTGMSGHLVTSFIVSKLGIADSLKILESISPEYDKLYIKAFNKTKKNWKPGSLNGKPVSVQIFQELTYSTSAQMLPSYDYTNAANTSFKNKNYDVALYYYDQALKSMPFDKENLYNRGICKKMLGNLAGACEDWKKIKELGGNQADALLEKYCK